MLKPQEPTDVRPAPASRPRGRLPFRRIIACLDRTPESPRIFAEAVAMADHCDAALTLLRVLPGLDIGAPCPDPVDWDLQRRAEDAELRHLAGTIANAERTQAVVTCGPVAACIRDEALRESADLLVVGAGSVGSEQDHWGLGSTTRLLSESFPGSLLVVPRTRLDDMPDRKPTRRVIVPIDGSPEAEAALRMASLIAGNLGAELVILHAIAPIGSGGDTRVDAEEAALLEALRRRSDHEAAERLARLRRLVPASAHRSRVRKLEGEDPRRALLRAIAEEQGELIVLSARGLGGDPDLPIGSTAEYLLSRAVAPVLLVRHSEAQGRHHAGVAPRRRNSVSGKRQ